MPGYSNTAYWVYVDEFGTVNIQDPSSELYIEVAVFIKDEERLTLENGIEEICQELCGGAELKSSRVGGDNAKRLKYLNKIGNLPFQYYALICNKKLISEGSGLIYKKSCYKNLHKQLNQMLQTLPGNVHFLIDKYGSPDFENSCKVYFEKATMGLIIHADFSFDYVDDKNNRVVQLADFIAGSLSYCFDKKKKDAVYSPSFRTILKKHELELFCYPRQQRAVSNVPPSVQDESFADDLRDRLYNQASRFLEENEDNDDECVQMQWHTLKRLFDASELEDKELRYIYADKLIEHLKSYGYVIGKRNFTVDVIGGLRRADIIIAGSPDGYKLALSLDDVNEYLEHNKEIILPMLHKLAKARNNIRMLMSYDILENAEYADLKELIEKLSESKLDNYAMADKFDVDSAEPLTNETPSQQHDEK